MGFQNDSGGFGTDNLIINIIKWVLGALLTICTLGLPLIIKAIKNNKKS